MSSDRKVTVHFTRLFTASPERVFDAWVTPGGVATWARGGLAGEMGLVKIDPRVGGRFSFVVKRRGTDVDHTGEYVEFDRPRRLSFTWGVPTYSKDLTALQLQFDAYGPGTQLTLIHEGVLKEFADRTSDGWNAICDAIEQATGTASLR